VKVEIRQATRDRIPMLAAMLARAFAEDPMILVTVAPGDPEDRMRRYFALIEEVWADMGVLWEAGEAAGVAAWVPPHQMNDLTAVNAALRDGRFALSVDGAARYDALWNWVESRIPDEPLWFLDMVGVDPDRQGEGIGAALVEFGLDRARHDGVPAFLETGIERNLAYYERFGFRVVEEGDAPKDGPHVWFMRFDP
jgi:GNAT superfamily N-acetyltransferase